MGIYIKIFFILLLVLNTEARPISYSGGHTLMHFNDNMKESIYYHYSPSFKYSIGVEELNNKIFDRSETNLRFTYLVNRKNTKNKEIKNIIDYTDKHIQLGFAPYLGAYGDLHTWLMLKTKKNSLSKKQITYPVLKFFKGNVLLEVGYDKKTDWDIHLMYRF